MQQQLEVVQSRYFQKNFNVFGTLFKAGKVQFYPRTLFGPLVLPAGLYALGPVFEHDDSSGRIELYQRLILPRGIKTILRKAGLLSRTAQNLLVEKKMLWCVRYAEESPLSPVLTLPFTITDENCYRVVFKDYRGNPKRSVLCVDTALSIPACVCSVDAERIVVYDINNKYNEARRIVSVAPPTTRPQPTDLRKIRSGLKNNQTWVILTYHMHTRRQRLLSNK